MGRYAQGVKLINIREDDSVGTVCHADKSDEPDHEDEDGGDHHDEMETPESE